MVTAVQNVLFKKKTFAVTLLEILILAVVYHLAARLGLKMAYVQINTSPVWPPTGIAIAALLLFGMHLWPGISLGVLLGSWLNGAQFNLALGMALGNTLEALVAVYCLRRFTNFRNAIDRVQDVSGLLVFAMLGTTVSATIGSLTLMLSGLEQWQRFPTIWLTWWIGDLLGALVVAPVLLVWLTPYPMQAKRPRWIESGLLLAALTLVTGYIFSNQPPAGSFHQALIYLIFPFIIWADLRLNPRAATLSILFVSGIAIWGTAQGMGPFSLESKNDNLILLQTFMAVVSLTSLILSAAIVERRKATAALHQRVEDLATLNDSSKSFLDSADPVGIFRTICELAVTRLGIEAAWIELLHREALEGSPTAFYGISAEEVQTQKSFWEAVGPTRSSDGAVIKIADHTVIPPAGGGTGYQVYATFPLLISGKKIGVLRLLSRNRACFAEDRQPLIQSFANLAAVAIQNNWLFEEVQKSNKQLHALTQRLIKAQEEERLHLSRELHDESGQLLAALRVQLGLLERDAGQPEITSQRIAELKLTTNEIKDNLHKLAVNLRPASLDHLGLVTALQQTVEEFSRQYNIQVELEAVGMQDRRLPIEIETALFRTVQESLTNVALHAQATHVDVLINLRNSHIVAIIEDNGVGFSPGPMNEDEHLGLFGMRERIEMLGGKFTIESSPGRGTAVSVEVPFDD